ncbi:hypothetical protein [Actinoallomurus iriomotensis]|uniref:Uncharacterized protein n=1 Tax=Actinoallomurus iriomotensis TaxID=478107 RepID=A0A9W6VT57_9ACTN|nr:hypothetical protein [Actinoallomurus iriomotensis]GLY84113.1 hypothetical protein Airi02_020420 [Actinoallomurus iriomotensis]
MRRLSLVHAAVLAGAASAAALTAVPAAAAETKTVDRGHDRTITFRADRAGEALVDVTAAAPGVSWANQGHESAVLSLYVDGRYATDDVVPAAFPISRQFALGHVRAGRHRLTLRFAADRSRGTRVQVSRTAVRVVSRGQAYLDLAHAPILYGRNGADWGGPFQNSSTDTPLVAWHEDVPAAVPGHRLLTYSYIWSNEDGGTSTPQLMARWGRTTDIEWIYQVEVDAQGRRVPGTAVIQAPNHVTQPFGGTYEGDHPLMQTCTLNNNICDTVDDPMRFFLSTSASLDAATEAREQIMDRNPWTYWVSDAESRREGKVEADPPTSSTTSIADPRDYLYLVVRKVTANPPNGATDWVGLSIGVRLKGDPTLYRSDHLFPDRSIQRDVPAATTVQLPPGTTSSDIAEITAIRVPTSAADPGSTIEVQAVNRAFFLGRDDEPQQSFLSGATPATLTKAAPTAVLYTG